MLWIWDAIWQFVFSTIPWWVFYGLAGAAVVAIVMYVPGKLGALAAAAVGAWLCAVGSYSMGCKTCSAQVNAAWEKRLDDELTRQRTEFGTQLLAEKMRAADAEQRVTELSDEVKRAVALAGHGTTVVIPEPVARSLCAIGQGKTDALGGCLKDQSRASQRPGKVQRVLPRTDQTAGPGWWLELRDRYNRSGQVPVK